MKRPLYRRMLIENLIPSIIAKGPVRGRQERSLILQQDGATSHIKEDDAQFRAALEAANFNNLKVLTQPANSPDLNVLDLGFFNALQGYNNTVQAENSETLIKSVQASFQAYPHHKLNRVFLTLQSVMNEIIDIYGDNDYKLPHMGKEKMEREGTLPVSFGSHGRGVFAGLQPIDD